MSHLQQQIAICLQMTTWQYLLRAARQCQDGIELGLLDVHILMQLSESAEQLI